MVRRRFIYCGIAAACILGGEVRAEENIGLRTTLDTPELSDGSNADGKTDSAKPIAIAAKPTTLEVNPAVEPPPPPLPKYRESADPYDALGIVAGGFTLFPVMHAGVIVSDNPGLVDSHRKGDIGARFRPSLRIASDWVRHELAIEGSGDLIYYDEEPENNSKAVNANARLRLDIRRSTTLTLAGVFDLSQDNGANSDTPDATLGQRTDYSYGGNAALRHNYGLIQTTLLAGADWYYYGNVDLSGGGQQDNADRNYVEPQAVLRVGYDASPAFQPFVEAAYAPRFRFETPDSNGYDRDSKGYRVAAGVAFDPSPLWSGELALTYQWRNYDDPSLESLDIFGLTGRVAWRPTELTTLALTLGDRIVETGTDGSSGALNYAGDLTISHDLRDNLTIHGNVGLTYEWAQGTDATELKLRGNAGVLWRMNPWVAWTLDYDLLNNDDSEPDSDYYENRLTAGIELRR